MNQSCVVEGDEQWGHRLRSRPLAAAGGPLSRSQVTRWDQPIAHVQGGAQRRKGWWDPQDGDRAGRAGRRAGGSMLASTYTYTNPLSPLPFLP